MHISNAVKKVKNLTTEQLKHFVQIAEIEIENYKKVIYNYPPERLRKHGEPFMAKLKRQKDVFLEELENRDENQNKTD